jgi:hypothetical protein
MKERVPASWSGEEQLAGHNVGPNHLFVNESFVHILIIDIRKYLHNQLLVKFNNKCN